MSHMQLIVYRKGALYSADCLRCSTTHYTHEWITDDHNARRDAMEAGTLRCDECGGTIDSDTFAAHKPSYAGRYSAPGYMDATEWSYGTNRRRLERELRDMYGDDDI